MKQKKYLEESDIVDFFNNEEDLLTLCELAKIIDNKNNKLNFKLNNIGSLKENLENILSYCETKSMSLIEREHLDQKLLLRELNRLILETFEQNQVLEKFMKKYFISVSI